VALLGDTEIKPGQIAHLNRDASNNNLTNLAFLCLEHHDEYDSRTSQSKGFTEAELRSYRDQLYETLQTIVSTEKQAGDGSLTGNLPTDDDETAPDQHERHIYTELWNSLFDFRIAAHNLVDWLQDRVHQDPHGTFIDTLNAYQAVVRRNEPFIVLQVVTPARAIISHGRKIAAATQQLQELHTQRDKCRDLIADEQIAEGMIKVDDEQQDAVEEIDRLFDEVKNAIQNRTMQKRSTGSSS
jgi:hypothetical protein